MGPRVNWFAHAPAAPHCSEGVQLKSKEKKKKKIYIYIYIYIYKCCIGVEHP
jgi:hypothetical protein